MRLFDDDEREVVGGVYNENVNVQQQPRACFARGGKKSSKDARYQSLRSIRWKIVCTDDLGAQPSFLVYPARVQYDSVNYSKFEIYTAA